MPGDMARAQADRRHRPTQSRAAARISAACVACAYASNNPAVKKVGIILRKVKVRRVSIKALMLLLPRARLHLITSYTMADPLLEPVHHAAACRCFAV